MRHDAKTADFITALHDGHESFRPMDLRLAVRIFHVSGVAIERGLHGPRSKCVHLLDQFGQFMNIMSAEYQVEVWHAFEQVFAFLLGHTATDADDYVVALLL